MFPHHNSLGRRRARFGTTCLREFNCRRRFFAAKSLKAAVVIPGDRRGKTEVASAVWCRPRLAFHTGLKTVVPVKLGIF